MISIIKQNKQLFSVDRRKMIKKLKIKNYKSLKDVELELDKFNVLIGPNASGKSNLLDCLAFVAELTPDNVYRDLETRGGYDRVVFGGRKEKIKISFEFVLDSKASEFFISLSETGIVEEELSIAGEKIIERPPGKMAKMLVPAPSGARYIKEMQLGGWDSAIKEYPEIRAYLTAWRSYNFMTSDMRRKDSAKKNLILEKTGRNLAQVLLSLHNERPKTFDKIEEILRQAIPQIDELLTPLTEEGDTYIAIREKGFDSPFNYFQVSDGTLKLLAYITAIASEEANVVCFEEPENFIHPRLFELLVEVLKGSDKQIILSTHSPYLVDFVEPEDVIIVEKKDNATVTSRIKDGDKLKERLAELGLALGEYWYGGGLGGNP
jgi:predicted ATPase